MVPKVGSTDEGSASHAFALRQGSVLTRFRVSRSSSCPSAPLARSSPREAPWNEKGAMDFSAAPWTFHGAEPEKLHPSRTR